MAWKRRGALAAPRVDRGTYDKALVRAEALSRGQLMEYVETTISDVIRDWGAYLKRRDLPDNLRAAAYSSQQLAALLEVLAGAEPNLLPPTRPTADLAVAQAVRG